MKGKLNLDKTFVQIYVGTVRVEARIGCYDVILRRADSSFRTVLDIGRHKLPSKPHCRGQFQ